jgi:5-methylcytosine-specific restriction endonuclease McrA
VGNGHTLDQLSEKYISQDGCCHWCGVKVGLKFEIDHVIPISRGGHDTIENIVISCGKCNRSKGDKLPEEWQNPKE